MGKKFSLKSIIIAAVALLGCIGTFLPWGVVKVFTLTQTITGTVGDGWLTFGAFIIIAGLAMGFVNKEKLPLGVQIAISILGAIAAIIVIPKIFDINSLGKGASAGGGLYYVAIIGVITAALPGVPINKTLGK